MVLIIAARTCTCTVQAMRLAVAAAKVRHTRRLSGRVELEQWLDGVEVGFAVFADALFVGGWRNVRDLRHYPPSRENLERCLVLVGARQTEVYRIADALAIDAPTTRSDVQEPTTELTNSVQEQSRLDSELGTVRVGVGQADHPIQPSSICRVTNDTIEQGLSDAPDEPTDLGSTSSASTVSSTELHIKVEPVPSTVEWMSIFDGRHAMLSYQWDAQEQVLQTRQQLEAMGVPCWIDVDHMVCC